ncbi:MAG: ATP-binding cassette domain-containing protein [Firmicutes bacterium]|nr:ATP-binding cassette domain-containing protein [Bacillota bacterium]
MNNAIIVENLNKTFKTRIKGKGFGGKLKSFFARKYTEKKAVDNISFTITEGEAVALIGPNGAGKSTTIKMLNGILFPTSGDINVLGLNPSKNRVKLSYQVGSVFGQKEQLWIHLSALDNFKFFGVLYDIKKDELNRRIKELCDLFEINEFINQPVKSLSLGQRMRCEMVASLLHKPKMLFFDEPTIGLDPIGKDTLRVLIKKINRELGTTVLFTSHDVGDIEEICKRVIIINHGKIVLDTSMKNLKYNYLKKKLVFVKLKEQIALKLPVGVELIKEHESAYTIEADMTKVSIDCVLALFPTDKIADISISNTPLEEIIKDIYKGGGT